MRDSRELITKVGGSRGLRCIKSTGDGYLLTFGDAAAAELGAVYAIESCFELLNLIGERNVSWLRSVQYSTTQMARFYLQE